jgi:uncharacterized protein (DUF58 family)
MARLLGLPQRGLSAGSAAQRRWPRLPRRLKVTREGKYFIAITFGVGFAAINTGNNLLYLLLGMLLALIIVSSVMSEMSIRDLKVTRRLPPRAQVGRGHVVEIEVTNPKKRIPSYAIEIEDLRDGQPADKRCFFLKVSPGTSQVAAYRRTPARRGRDRHVGFRIATRFPFGLFEKSRELTCAGDLVIYPAVDAVVLPPRPAITHMAAGRALQAGSGIDILSVRAMREGDEQRDIYWRKSSQQLVVRERARESAERIDLTLDNSPPSVAPGDTWTRNFEFQLRDVASRGVAHLKRGDSVLVRCTAGESVRADRVSGADPLLRFLALLRPESGPVASLTLPPPPPGVSTTTGRPEGSA